MKRFSSGLLAIMAAGCLLITAALSAPAQGRDRDRSDTGNYQQHDRNHDRGGNNGRAYGQYNRNYQGNGTSRRSNGQYNHNYQRNGSYRRSSSAPFAYIGAADQQRNGYTTRRHRHRRHRH